MPPLRFLCALAMAITCLAVGCGGGGGSGSCPGMCPDEPWPPTMTITTADGTASIASATVANGPCAVLSFASAGEAGAPTSYAAVRVSYAGPRTIPPPMCVIELTSVAGGAVDLGVHVTSSADQQLCCPYQSCCPGADAATVIYRVVFDPVTVTVSFPPSPDGGGADAGAGDGADGADGADAPNVVPEAADGQGPSLDESVGDLGGEGASVDSTGGDVPADLPIGGVEEFGGARRSRASGGSLAPGEGEALPTGKLP